VFRWLWFCDSPELITVAVTNFFGIVKTAELASQGFWTFDRTAIVILGRIAAL
jgi:hypothetical protein